MIKGSLLLWAFFMIFYILERMGVRRTLTCLKSVQKNFKKALTLNLHFGIVALHTVTYKQKMRTKTLLLSAAAVVAGLISAQAQSNVFSANIVGYVTLTNAANQFSL